MDGRHGCAGIIVTEDPGRPIIACRCGEIASGVQGQTWKVMRHDDATVSLLPSLDWPGHFHEYAVGVPIIEYDDLAALIDGEVGTKQT